MVCLGDYIYAESYHSKHGTKTAVRDDKIGKSNPGNKSVVREALTLDDYRAKYSLYRSDASLRKVQAKFPTIILWDDHEVQDNYAGAAPNGGLPPGKRFSAARRRDGRAGVLREPAALRARGDEAARTAASASARRWT